MVGGRESRSVISGFISCLTLEILPASNHWIQPSAACKAVAHNCSRVMPQDWTAGELSTVNWHLCVLCLSVAGNLIRPQAAHLALSSFWSSPMLMSWHQSGAFQDPKGFIHWKNWLQHAPRIMNLHSLITVMIILVSNMRAYQTRLPI